MNLRFCSFTSKRKFGVELEVNQKLDSYKLADLIRSPTQDVDVVPWGYTINNDEWIVKPDSTCSDSGDKDVDGYGWEAISPASRGVKHLLDIASVTEKLRSGGAVVNPHCGFHCQVEVADFADKDIATLLARWIKMEPVVAGMVPSHRIGIKGSKYCKLFSKKYSFDQKSYEWKDFWGLVRPKRLDAKAKRTAITVINYCRSNSHYGEWQDFYRKTVELRLPEGTLNPYDVKNWTRMFVHFVETSRDQPFPENIKSCNLEEALMLMGLHGSDEFFVLSGGLYETKRWVLNRIVQFGKEKLIKQAKKCLADLSDDDISIPTKVSYLRSPITKKCRT